VTSEAGGKFKKFRVIPEVKLTKKASEQLERCIVETVKEHNHKNSVFTQRVRLG
jgi:hypothetical protein